MKLNNHQLIWLDGLRGIAALCVVAYHLQWIHHFRYMPNNGFLAVDFFFVLSGFVLMYAYGEKLKSGTLTISTFLKVRVIRFFPLYLLGTTLGFIATLKALSSGDISDFKNYHQAIISYILSLFMLPSDAVRDRLFPLNVPAWSLFFEVLINIFLPL